MKKPLKEKGRKNMLKTRDVYSDLEMRRYLGALTETHNEHLKAIREGSIITNRKIDNITGTLSEHTKILSEHTKKIDSHTEMIGSLMEDVSVLKSDMTVVKEDVSVIRGDLKRKVDYDDFLSLVRRVQNLEAKI